jgi:hypothetical protein
MSNPAPHTRFLTVPKRHLEIPGVSHQQYDDDAVEGGEIAHHA